MVMVGSAGNTPVRHFQFYFVTPDLQAGNWIASREKIGLPSVALRLTLVLTRLAVGSERRMVAGVGVTPT
jgi:hypothetical protein